jgi:flagellar biosynthesis protein FlhF
MNIQRFHAPTAREALALARAAFGDATLILSNRQTSTGVEVMASTEEALSPLGALQSQAQPAAQPQAPAPKPLAPSRPAASSTSSIQTERRLANAAPTPYALVSAGGATTEEVVQADVEQLAMSTLSFQDYVRERMLRRQTESTGAAPTPAPAPAQARGTVPQPPPQPQPQPPQYRLTEPQQTQSQPPSPRFNDPSFFAASAVAAPAQPVSWFQPEPTTDAAPAPAAFVEPPPMAAEPPVVAQEPASAPVVAQPAPTPSPEIAPIAVRPAEPDAAKAVAAASLDATRVLMAELDAMKRLMEERFNTLSWLGHARRDPVHSNLMLKLMRAGYSPALAREVLEPLDTVDPVDDADDAVEAMLGTLERRLGIDAFAPSIVEEGGIFALIGATGVGKTTTIAKLASQCAARWGAASVGLVTLDVQRAGAHEQLRAFGRELGIVAHQAHDRAELQEMLSLLSLKRLVLIDTAGIAPRDPQRQELLDLIDVPGVKRVVVLNAGAHGDTLDEIATAFTADGTHQAVLTKIDEAAKIGPALDALMRHRMTLRGVTDGQRVPQDWRAADARELVALSMDAGQRTTALDPVAADLDFYFSPAACAL